MKQKHHNQFGFIKTVAVGILAGVACLSLVACDNSDKEPQKKLSALTAGLVPGAAQTIRIADLSGNPVASAQVLIGDGVGRPFQNNFITSDGSGVVQAPSDWTSPQAVTISAPGYIRTTFLKQLPEGQVLQIRNDNSANSFELTGVTNGYDSNIGHGTVDLGMVIQGLAQEDLFNFQVGMVVSSQEDTMSVVGKQVNVPSNISIPTQKQTYILPITLSKPSYRLYFDSTGPKHVFTGHGQFDFNTMVNAAENHTPYYEMINNIHLVSGSFTPVTITSGTTNMDLPVTGVNFDSKLNLNVPAFSSDQVVVSLALAQSDGEFFPTDIQEIEQAGVLSLATTTSATPYVAAVLKNKSEFASGPGMLRLSAELVPFTNGVTPEFLPLMADPQSPAPTGFQIAALTSPPADVMPLATYAALSTVTTDPSNSKSSIVHHIWEVYDPEWSTSYTLPQWPNDTTPTGSKRWEISRLGQTSAAKASDTNALDLGPGLFQHATHATHASADF